MLPLVSKAPSSKQNESTELIDLVAAFEAINKCKITFTCLLALRKGYLDLKWDVSAWNRPEGNAEAGSLVLANVSVWGGDYLTLLALHTRLLYALDFQLALNEFDKVETKKA